MVLSACSPYFKSLLEVSIGLILSHTCWKLMYVSICLGKSFKTSHHHSKRCSLCSFASHSRIHVCWWGECGSGSAPGIPQNGRATQSERPGWSATCGQKGEIKKTFTSPLWMIFLSFFQSQLLAVKCKTSLHLYPLFTKTRKKNTTKIPINLGAVLQTAIC